MMTESTSSGFTLAADRAALAAVSCKSTQVLPANFPPKVPNGVRFAPTMKIPRVREAILKENLVEDGGIVNGSCFCEGHSNCDILSRSHFDAVFLEYCRRKRKAVFLINLP